MADQTCYDGPLQIIRVGTRIDIYRCHITDEGSNSYYVAELRPVGRQWQLINARTSVTLGYVRRNAWQRWEALEACGETCILTSTASTMSEAIEAVLEQR